MNIKYERYFNSQHWEDAMYSVTLTLPHAPYLSDKDIPEWWAFAHLPAQITICHFGYECGAQPSLMPKV